MSQLGKINNNNNAFCPGSSEILLRFIIHLQLPRSVLVETATFLHRIVGGHRLQILTISPPTSIYQTPPSQLSNFEENPTPYFTNTLTQLKVSEFLKGQVNKIHWPC